MSQKQKKAVKKIAPDLPLPASPAGGLAGLMWPAVVMAITFAVFLPTRQNAFINWDDNIYVFENGYMTRPLGEAIAHFFRLNYYLGAYTPLTMSVFALEAHFWGIDPAAFHMVSLCLHVIAVGLVYLLCLRLSGGSKRVAAITALLFGIHPMHAESVLWAAELKDPLYAIFFLAGLILYYRYATEKMQPAPNTGSRTPVLLGGTLACFVLSCLAKPAAVTFPAVMLLFDFYLNRKMQLNVWLEKIPFVIVSVTIGIITLGGQDSYGLMSEHYPLATRLLFAAHNIIEYLWKLAVPTGLCIFYPYPKVAGGLPATYYLWPLLVAALAFGVYKSLKYGRAITFGSLFFLVTIFLTLQIISPGMSMIADHYTYMPYLGLFFIIGMGFEKLYTAESETLKPYRLAAAAALVLFAGACAVLSYNRCAAWLTQDTIADEIIDRNPDNEVALNNKGFLLSSFGKAAESIPYFRRVLQLRPDYTMAYANLVNALVATNNVEGAERVADSGVHAMPNENSLYTSKGFTNMLLHRYDTAIAAYAHALVLKSQEAAPYLGMARCYVESSKNYDTALVILDRGIRQLPADVRLSWNKGYVLYLAGRYADAARVLDEYLQLRPGDNSARDLLNKCHDAMNAGALR